LLRGNVGSKGQGQSRWFLFIVDPRALGVAAEVVLLRLILLKLALVEELLCTGARRGRLVLLRAPVGRRGLEGPRQRGDRVAQAAAWCAGGDAQSVAAADCHLHEACAEPHSNCLGQRKRVLQRDQGRPDARPLTSSHVRRSHPV
jgi:hypothetical protein